MQQECDGLQNWKIEAHGGWFVKDDHGFFEIYGVMHRGNITTIDESHHKLNSVAKSMSN